ncbi:hypothetical protein ABPG75_003270 [Micractinium tetrahymenae]
MAARGAAALLALALLVVAAAGRSLQQGPTPKECSGTFTEQWSKDEIECHFPTCDGNPQLKCEHHAGVVGQERVSCELDASIVSPAINFDCPVSGGVVMCNWAMVKSKLPGCAYEPTRKILTGWQAS